MNFLVLPPRSSFSADVFRRGLGADADGPGGLRRAGVRVGLGGIVPPPRSPRPTSTDERMWAQDVAASVGYHGGASTAAAALSSWRQASQSLPAPTAAFPALNSLIGNVGALNMGARKRNANLAATETSATRTWEREQGRANLGNGNIGPRNIGNGNFG